MKNLTLIAILMMAVTISSSAVLAMEITDALNKEQRRKRLLKIEWNYTNTAQMMSLS